MSKTKLLILLAGLVLLLGFRFYSYYKTLPVYHDGQRMRIIGTVTEEPQITTGKQKLKIKSADGFRATVITQVVPMYQQGDKLAIDGVFTRRSFQGNDYWTIYFPNLQSLKNDQNMVTDAAQAVRNEAKNLFESTLPPVSSSLLLGMVLGGKHGMPTAFLEKLRTVGVLHVIAASGMNVSFVALALVAILGKLLRRQFSLFTAILGIGFYVIVAGFEPSIVRAGIMTSLTIGATLLGRQSAAILTLGITGLVMLVVSPGLWQDVGFQLSFLSTLGILTLKQTLDKGLESLGKFGALIGDDVTTTTAAQIATLPVMLGVFGNYGLLSVLVNALVLWTIPILMVLGSLAILLGSIFEPLGKLPLFLSYPFLWYFERVVDVFGGTRWMLTIPKVSAVIWIGYYLLLISVTMAQQKRLTPNE